jgi:glycosyltransferase involved in cell wall biosynthesis
MALLNRRLGAGCTHVVHCQLMKDDFLARYATQAGFLFLPPTITANHDLPAPAATPHDRFTIGFMSNLTLAKGLGLAIDTFSQLAEAGREVRLILAGRCHGKREQQLIEDARQKWPDRVEYRGPVYGDDKQQFFADIDAFLFPTRYKNESWGIVISEALAAHRPVIACRRACVPWIVQDGCGIVVDRPADFADVASQTISRWMDNRQEYEHACQMAGKRAGVLDDEAQSQFANFLQRMREL